MMRLSIGFLALCSLASCALGGKRMLPNAIAVEDDSSSTGVKMQVSAQHVIRAIQWHLLRAAEARNSALFSTAQRELDHAFSCLAQFDNEDDAHGVVNETADKLRRTVEQAYLNLLPHIENLSPESPLVLLLEGISEAELESLPKDASLYVRIHQ